MSRHIFETREHFARVEVSVVRQVLQHCRVVEEPYSVGEKEVGLTGGHDELKQFLRLRLVQVPLQEERANLRNEELEIVPESGAKVRVNTTVTLQILDRVRLMRVQLFETLYHA